MTLTLDFLNSKYKSFEKFPVHTTVSSVKSQVRSRLALSWWHANRQRTCTFAPTLRKLRLG